MNKGKGRHARPLEDGSGISSSVPREAGAGYRQLLRGSASGVSSELNGIQ